MESFSCYSSLWSFFILRCWSVDLDNSYRIKPSSLFVKWFFFSCFFWSIKHGTASPGALSCFNIGLKSYTPNTFCPVWKLRQIRRDRVHAALNVLGCVCHCLAWILVERTSKADPQPAFCLSFTTEAKVHYGSHWTRRQKKKKQQALVTMRPQCTTMFRRLVVSVFFCLCLNHIYSE